MGIVDAKKPAVLKGAGGFFLEKYSLHTVAEAPPRPPGEGLGEGQEDVLGWAAGRPPLSRYASLPGREYPIAS